MRKSCNQWKCEEIIHFYLITIPKIGFWECNRTSSLYMRPSANQLCLATLRKWANYVLALVILALWRKAAFWSIAQKVNFLHFFFLVWWKLIFLIIVLRQCDARCINVMQSHIHQSLKNYKLTALPSKLLCYNTVHSKYFFDYVQRRTKIQNAVPKGPIPCNTKHKYSLRIIRKQSWENSCADWLKNATKDGTSKENSHFDNQS